MSSPAETIANIQVNGTAGFLVLYSDKITWSPKSGKDSENICILPAEINSVCVTPDHRQPQQILVRQQTPAENGIKKIIFTIESPGESSGLEVKYRIVEALKQLSRKRKHEDDNVNAKLKSKILNSHPNIEALYKQLVESQMVPEKEFWEQHVDQNILEIAKRHQRQVPASGLTLPIKFQSEGSGKSSIELTNDHIKAIFHFNPSLKNVYLEAVGKGKVSETQFWTDYLRRCSNEEQGILGMSVKWGASMKEKIKANKQEIDELMDHVFENSNRGGQKSEFCRAINLHSIRMLENMDGGEKKPIPKKLPEKRRLNMELSKHLDQMMTSYGLSNPKLKVEPAPIKKIRMTSKEMVSENDLMDNLENRITAFEEKKNAQIVIPNLDGIKDVIAATNQILRNFWKCFPLTHKAIFKKAVSIVEQITIYKTTKIDVLIKEGNLNEYELNTLECLSFMLDKAIERRSTMKVEIKHET